MALAVLSGAAGGGAGCSLLLETDSNSNPQVCRTDADCARYPNAACDNARKLCVPRLPYGGSDAGAPPDAGVPLDDGGSGGLSCQLSFDNRSRVRFNGPDGGLRPLPEGP